MSATTADYAVQYALVPQNITNSKNTKFDDNIELYFISLSNVQANGHIFDKYKKLQTFLQQGDKNCKVLELSVQHNFVYT